MVVFSGFCYQRKLNFILTCSIKCLIIPICRKEVHMTMSMRMQLHERLATNIGNTNSQLINPLLANQNLIIVSFTLA